MFLFPFRGLSSRFPVRSHRYSSLSPKPRYFLGIDTSCDDTGIGVVSERGEILANVTLGQWDVHSQFRGVVPLEAQAQHRRVIDEVLLAALRQAQSYIQPSTGQDQSSLDLPLSSSSSSSSSGELNEENKEITRLARSLDLQGVAVCCGPGLVPCLRVGASRATSLAKSLGLPLFQVNHLEGHILSARLSPTTPGLRLDTPSSSPVSFPFLNLLVSGGHSQLILASSVGTYRLLGGTLDDSLGEAFDKVARLLDIPYYDFENNVRAAAGLEKLARSGSPSRIPLPVPLRGRKKSADFSFSGLKSCVARMVSGKFDKKLIRMYSERNSKDAFFEKQQEEEEEEEGKDKNKEEQASNPIRQDGETESDGPTGLLQQPTAFRREDIAAAFQDTALNHVVDRTKFALQQCLSDPDLMSFLCGQQIKDLVVTGGVACNQALRHKIQSLASSFPGIQPVFPQPELCTDNGAMIAWVAQERVNTSMWDLRTMKIPSEDPFTYPRWPLDPTTGPKTQFKSDFCKAQRLEPKNPWKKIPPPR